MSNFMLAVIESTAKSNESEGLMEVSDGKMTEYFANELMKLYNFYNSLLQQDAKDVSTWAGKDQDNKDNQAGMQAAQVKFQKDSTTAQAEENQGDSAVQSAQNQTSADGSNLAMMAQYAQQMNSVMSALSNLLGNLLR